MPELAICTFEIKIRLPEEIRPVYREVLECQRQLLLKKNRTEPQLDEDVLRKLLRHIDVRKKSCD